MMGLSVWGFYAASSHPPSLSPLEMWRRKKKKLARVYMYGCVDMMHYGHCNVFRQARAIATNRSSASPEMPRLLLTRVLPLLLSTKDGYDAYALSKKAGQYKQIKRTEGVSSTDIVDEDQLVINLSIHLCKDSSAMVTARNLKMVHQLVQLASLTFF